MAFYKKYKPAKAKKVLKRIALSGVKVDDALGHRVSGSFENGKRR